MAAVAGLATTAPLLDASDFCLDDAWIHLAYARSLQQGDGFSYNPGDLATGFSSPLWALLLAVVAHGSNVVFVVKALGVALHAATCALAAALAWEVSSSSAPGHEGTQRDARWAALAAGLVTATLGHLVMSATSGMEVCLASTLVLATALATLRGAAHAAFTLAFLGVLARPETLFFSCVLGALVRVRRGQVTALAAPAGALLALLVWVLYCLSVSGYPWPNTMYVKGNSNALRGLEYFWTEVVLQQPWVIGASGAAVLGFGLLRAAGALRWLLVAWLATALAIACTRELSVGALFFHYRYFAIVAAVPAVGIAVSLTALRPTWARGLALVPVLAVAGSQWPEVQKLQHATQADIAELHSAPARQLARTLPKDAVLLVEGAGAMRYFTPRALRVIDVVGLNHDLLAHVGLGREDDCVLQAEHPTHAALPDEWLPAILPVFVTRPMGRVTDDHHHSGRRVFPRTLHFFEILGPNAEIAAECQKLAEAAASAKP